MADICSINDFIKLSDSDTRGNGVFVRILGENNSYLSDISNMDRQLCDEMSRGRVAYKRICELPKPVSQSDAAFYTDVYNSWKSSADKRTVTRVTRNNQELAVRLGSACVKCCSVLRKANPHLNDAMEKNFIVKQLYRFDSVFIDLTEKTGFKRCVKIVGENVVKLQDCLFFYMLVLMGINVILLQNKTDIDIEVKRLELSKSCVLGHLGTSDIPKFRDVSSISSGASQPPRSVVGQSRVSQSPTVRMTIPPRPSTRTENSKVTPPLHQNSGSVKVTIPPRPNTQRNTVQDTRQGGSVRVTIPPRPGSGTVSQTNRPNQSNGGVRLTIPPLHGSSTGNPQAVPPQNNSGSRVTIPPQSSGRYNSSGINQSSRMPTPQTQLRREKSYEEIAQLASSIVLIYTMKKRPFSQGEGEVIGMGSGIMIGQNGYILTNCHVIRGGDFFGVRLENDEQIHLTSELIKYHNDLDLAVLRIDKRLNPLKVYDGAQPLVRGQKVVAIGSPLGLFNTVSDGIISGFRKVDKKDMIQFTAPISNGSSGGAVLNMYGEVIGISTAGIDDGQNINLAVGFDAINNFARGFMV